MKIMVKLFSILKEGRFEEAEIDLGEGASLDDLLVVLGLAREEVGLVMVNGQSGMYAQPFHDGDTVSLIPFLGGG